VKEYVIDSLFICLKSIALNRRRL